MTLPPMARRRPAGHSVRQAGRAHPLGSGQRRRGPRPDHGLEESVVAGLGELDMGVSYGWREYA
jgi:hypothetical protein